MDSSPTIAIAHDPERDPELKCRLVERLRAWADPIVLGPHRDHPDLVDLAPDLYHMARWSIPAYADFERAADAGIPTINAYEGARITEDRLETARRIAASGLPYVEFQYGTVDEITLKPPVFVKPRHELDPAGHEFRIVFAGELEFEGERLVERYVVPNRSFKVFRVGERVRATEFLPGHDGLVEVAVSAAFRVLTDEVAALFDLRLFELDVLVHKAYYIIDVNPVVSLEGVEDGLELYEGLLRAVCECG